MRIIAGRYRTRKIDMPKGVEIRPTQDRVREAVFNIIRLKVEGARVLDLCAGSGAFGIEGISRGASSVLFVDNNIKCVRTIRKNVSSLGIAGVEGIWRMDACRAIKRIKEAKRGFDVIFLDPPYYRNLAKKILISIDDCDILEHLGIVVAEHHKKDEIPRDFKHIRLFQHREYGDTIISIYSYNI